MKEVTRHPRRDRRRSQTTAAAFQETFCCLLEGPWEARHAVPTDTPICLAMAGQERPGSKLKRTRTPSYNAGVSPRAYTSKQMGDACEMLVASEMTLAGVPAMKMPDNWPGYDVIAQPRDGRPPQRISVKSRTFKRGGATFVDYSATDQFDWLAIVLLPGDDQTNRRIFIIPRGVADDQARRDKPTSKSADDRYWRQDEIPEKFATFEANFCLSPTGIAVVPPGH